MANANTRKMDDSVGHLADQFGRLATGAPGYAGVPKPEKSQAVSGGLTEFHLFPELDSRLRRMIWEKAFQSTPGTSKVYRFRVSIVKSEGSKVACFTPSPEVADLTRDRIKLLGVNKETRAEVLGQHVDALLPFNYINRATNKVASGVFPMFDLDSVFCLDMDGATAQQLFANDVKGTSLLSSIRVLGVAMQFPFELRAQTLQGTGIDSADKLVVAENPSNDTSQSALLYALFYAHKFAFKNIQRLAIVPKAVYERSHFVAQLRGNYFLHDTQSHNTQLDNTQSHNTQSRNTQFILDYSPVSTQFRGNHFLFDSQVRGNYLPLDTQYIPDSTLRGFRSRNIVRESRFYPHGRPSDMHTYMYNTPPQPVTTRPKPVTTTLVSWHDWAGVVEQSKFEFTEPGNLSVGGIHKRLTKAGSIFGELYKVMWTKGWSFETGRKIFHELYMEMLTDGPDFEKTLRRLLDADGGRVYGPNMVSPRALMVVVPAMEDVSDLMCQEGVTDLMHRTVQPQQPVVCFLP